MRLKNILLLLLLAGSFTTGTAQEKTTNPKIAVTMDSIFNKLDDIYKLQDTIQKKREAELDSVFNTQEGKKHSEFGIMAQIEKNTYEDFWESGWTAFAISTLIISIITFLAQMSTESHTRNVSIDSQLGMLEDLPRHFYRNLVCTVAMLLKYRHRHNRNTAEGTFKSYPSEGNVMKLQTLPEEFILPIDMGNDKIFDEMHEQKLLFKNYNIEVATASEHFSRKNIKEKSLVNDYDNLLFKPIFLIRNICKLYGMLKKKKCRFTRQNPEKYVCNVVCTFVMEHFNKLNFSNISSGMQMKYFDGIYRNEDFEEYIRYDSSTKYDKPGEPIYRNGIERSLNLLLGMLKDEKLKLFITCEKGKYIIKRSEFITYFLKAKKDEIERNKIKDKVDNILKSKDIAIPMKEYGLNGVSYEKAVKSYLSFWQKDKWEVKNLLYNMLKIDAISEFTIIGMIEHDT